MKQKVPRCHVCGKPKKPYAVFITNNIMDMINYKTAREGGEICEGCWNYYCLTGELKPHTRAEWIVAKEARDFAKKMLDWWNNKESITYPENIELEELEQLKQKNMREWEGTEEIARWYRTRYRKKDKQ